MSDPCAKGVQLGSAEGVLLGSCRDEADGNSLREGPRAEDNLVEEELVDRA